jgi:hypothetical protein
MLFGAHRQGCGRLPVACIPAQGVDVLRRSVKYCDSAWSRAKHVNRIDTVWSWITSPACIVSKPHKRFSSEKAWIWKVLSSCDHTAIFEKMHPWSASGL